MEVVTGRLNSRYNDRQAGNRRGLPAGAGSKPGRYPNSDSAWLVGVEAIGGNRGRHNATTGQWGDLSVGDGIPGSFTANLRFGTRFRGVLGDQLRKHDRRCIDRAINPQASVSYTNSHNYCDKRTIDAIVTNKTPKGIA